MHKVKLIIAGGRDFQDYHALKKAFAEFMKDYDNEEVAIISGMARGADTLGIQIANEYLLDVIKMPADWDTHGKSAGYIRNKEMAKIGTHLLAAWNNISKGTKHMIDLARIYKLTIKIVPYNIKYPLPKPIEYKGL